MGNQTIGGGDIVARVLENAGIDAVFGLTGGHISPVIEACDERGIDVLTTRHEQNAGFMAAAWGIMNRQPGVCLLTAGPGHTNAYSAFTQAHESHYPLVSLSGQYELTAEGRGALQEIDQVAMVEEVSKYAKQADTPDRLGADTEQALRQSVAPPRGHAHVSLPRDVLAATVPQDEVKSMPADRYLHAPDCPGDEQLIASATEALHRADRPVVIVGGGAWFSEAGDALAAFVTQLQVPTFTHEEARGLIPDSHELCFGSPLFKLNGASRRIHDSDCVLLFDVTLDWRMDYGEPPMLPDASDATLVQVDHTAEHIGEQIPVDFGIVADTKSALEQFVAAAAPYDWTRPNDWVATLSGASEAFDDQYADAVTSEETPVHPGRLCADLAEVVTPSTRIVFDGGNIGKWGKYALDAEKPGRWLRLKGPFACLGYGLPTALAVQHYAPDDDVVLLTGDGSFGYNVMEIETAVRYDLPVTIVVANNGAWGSVGGGETPVGTELPHTRFHELAEDLDAKGELITEPDDVAPAIERGIASEEPYCLNIRAGNAYAPVDYPKTLKGY